MNRPVRPASSLIQRLAMAGAAAALAGSLAVTSSAPASAAGDPVDPATLTPAPPDFFNASCFEVGQSIRCDLAFIDPEQPVEAPTGIICGSGATAFEVLDTFTRSVRGKRYYTADGLLVRRHFTDDIDGIYTNSVTGATVTYVQHGSHLVDNATPGDDSSGIQQDNSQLRVFSSNGTVVMDTGRVVFAVADPDNPLFEAGQHPIGEYFTGADPNALQPLCDALAK
jgi:hypothetical protein